MSITPRASVLWTDTNTSMSYFPEEGTDNGDDDLEQQLIPSSDDVYDDTHDGRTALDKTIDRIGMGAYIDSLSFFDKSQSRSTYHRKLSMDALVALWFR